jgi:hypothetical protein
MGRGKRYRTRRGKPEDQYFGLFYPMARSPAFRSLSGAALKVFIELRTRFNGCNNGDLSLSLDEAARLLGIGKATAQRAFAELAEKGFIAMTKKGQWYGRRATTWRATDKGCNGELPTNDWKRWQPPGHPPDLRPEIEPAADLANGSAPGSGRVSA